MLNDNTYESYNQQKCDNTTKQIDLHNTQENCSIDDNDMKECCGSASRFLKRFGVVKLLGECGAYKEKGVPVAVIFLYIFNLIFSPMSMYYQMKIGAFHEEFSPILHLGWVILGWVILGKIFAYG